LWSFTGSDKQLWRWSESGNKLINVATGKPLAVGGFTEWRVTNSSDWPYAPMLETHHGGKVLDSGWTKDGCGAHIGVGNWGGHGSQFSLHLADQFEGNPDYDCAPTSPAPTTTGAPTTAGPTKAPSTKPTTPPTTATAQETTVESVEGCTEDGSNVLADEIIVENLYDLSVLADDGSGKLVLQRPDTSSLSSSSLQKWQVAPLCNGKYKVINVGTGNVMSSGPWTYDSENKLLQSADGLWAWNMKRKGLRFNAKVRYLKNTTTPWKRFQWNIVQV